LWRQIGMRRFIITVSVAGFLLFASGLVISLVNPLLIERMAREIVRIEIEHRVGEKVDALSNSKIVSFSQRVLSSTNRSIEETQAALRNELPQKVANVVADMLKADCECRKRLAAEFQQLTVNHLNSLSNLRERLNELIASSYAAVRNNLMREFRIFCGSNAVAFALLGFIAWIKRGATLQLLLPTTVILGAVAITAFLYVFKQDWLHTIVFNDYVGFGYSAYLAAVALLLADILLNKARITTELVNAIGGVIGSVSVAVPC
jgi:hypothetical protein